MSGFPRRLLRSVSTGDSLYPLLGGCLFLAVFLAAYSRIPADFYQVRDDGVITMSHARNLVDYGFIGVSPSGPRVEGYSAPLQLYVYGAVYAVSHVGYAGFARFQTIVFTLLLGFLFVRFLQGNRFLLLGLAAVSALLLTRQTSFFLWHGSGLENPITHCLFLASVGVLGGFLANGRIRYAWAALLFLASISRVDSVFHVAALLVLFSVFWLIAQRNLRGLLFAFAVFALWGAYQTWRYLYFGDLFPNTAYAQGTDFLGRCTELLRLDRRYLSTGLKLSNRLLSSHGIYLLLPALPLLAFVRWSRRLAFLLLAALVLIVSGYLYPLFFGRSLLDPSRTTSHMPVMVAFSMAAILTSIRSRKILLWAALAVAFPVILILSHTHEKPGYLCCSVGEFEKVRREVHDLAVAQDLPRPTVANPDLGVISWYKEFNIVDLGMLGSPVISRAQYGPLLSDYFFDYAVPDIIECHGNWSGRYYRTILSDPRFGILYEPVRVEMTNLVRAAGGSVPSGIWIRKDILKGSGSRERGLIDDLRRSPSVKRLQEEIAWCEGQPGTSRTYIARSAYRFLPEFKKSGQRKKLAALFAGSATRDFDLFLVNGSTDGRATAKGLAFLMDTYLEAQLGMAVKDAQPIIRSAFDVYLANGKLIYLKKRCSRREASGRFFVEVLPVGRDQFHQTEFPFKERGYDFGDRCLVIHTLPDVKIQTIRTGESIPGGPRLWEGTWEAGAGAEGRDAQDPGDVTGDSR